MNDELERLDSAIVDARQGASEALIDLQPAQAALLDAISGYTAVLIIVRIDAARRASVEAMSRLTDDQLFQFRVRLGRLSIEAQRHTTTHVTKSDLWLPQVSMLEPSDVERHGDALTPSIRAEASAIPHTLLSLFDAVLGPIRDELATMRMADIKAEPDARFKKTLAYAWFTYREAALGCLAKWSDVEDRLRLRAARAEDLRWEGAGTPVESAPEQEPAELRPTPSSPLEVWRISGDRSPHISTDQAASTSTG